MPFTIPHTQVLCALPEVKERYGDAALGVFKTASEDIAKDFPSQASPGAKRLADC